MSDAIGRCSRKRRFAGRRTTRLRSASAEAIGSDDHDVPVDCKIPNTGRVPICTAKTTNKPFMPSAPTLWPVDLGQQTEESATIRVAPFGLPAEASWRGAVRGPYCSYASTLAADYQIDRDGIAVIPEPCYWTPSLPLLYRLKIEAVVEGAVIQSVDQSIGLRRLEARSGHLYWEGRRTVLRGTRLEACREFPATNDEAWDVRPCLTEARAAGAALWMRGYDSEVCRWASEQGTPLIADLSGMPDAGQTALLCPALAPAVVATIVDDAPSGFDPARTGMLLAQAMPLGKPVELQPWASLAAISVSDAADVPAWVADLQIPVIALCPTNADVSLTEARRQADRLQAALAPQFDFAGYFV